MIAEATPEVVEGSFYLSRTSNAPSAPKDYCTVGGCILVASMAPDKEEQVCNALVNLGWLENDHALHAEGVQSIRDALQCSLNEAKAMLGELRFRKRIDVAVMPDGVAKLRWIRPPTSRAKADS